jgi:hypothetical protein
METKPQKKISVRNTLRIGFGVLVVQALTALVALSSFALYLYLKQ